MPLSDADFHRLADLTLDRVAQVIEITLGDQVDVEQQEGILTLDLADGGRYQINKHGENRQIWLSSPKSGAWHFACAAPGAPWLSTRDSKTSLDGLLRQELMAVTGVTIDLAL